MSGAGAHSTQPPVSWYRCSFAEVKQPGVNLANHLCLMPRMGMNGATPFFKSISDRYQPVFHHAVYHGIFTVFTTFFLYLCYSVVVAQGCLWTLVLFWLVLQHFWDGYEELETSIVFMWSYTFTFLVCLHFVDLNLYVWFQNERTFCISVSLWCVLNISLLKCYFLFCHGCLLAAYF
jgi:hypothetical protein